MMASKRTKSKEAAKPPSGDTPRSQHFPQPARRGGEDQLPVVAIGSVDFEKFCRGLLRIEYSDVVRSELKRDKGVAQYGVDIEGFNADQAPYVVVSCKCYRDAKARHLLRWTKEFTEHLHCHWKDKGIKTFVLAATLDGNDDDVNAAAREVAEHLKQFGINFDLWTNQKMSDLARKDSGLIGIYFSSYWQEAFRPRAQGAEIIAGPETTAVNLGTSPAIAALSREVAARLSERDAVIAKRLDEAQAAFRAGRVTALKACLDDIQNDTSVWETLDNNVRAKTLRAHVLLALHQGDAAAALTSIDDADTYAAPADRSLRAAVLRANESAEAALAFLGEAASDRESEIKASLLLEVGRVGDAVLELDRLPGDRPECQRLRAIALCLKGERHQAVALADAARKAEPSSVLGQQTLGILHVMSALTTRTDVQLGSMPNPIDPGLVRGAQDALDHLAAAEQLFSNLAATLEPPAKVDAEIWLLASLILHPDKRENARKLGRELLEREVIEPIAVAWCRIAGLPVRHGHIRKILSDALRQGNGSPSHIIVDAMLAADKDGPTAAVAVIDRYVALFPKAADFLEGWSKRFAGTSDEDIVFSAISNTGNADRFSDLVDNKHR